MGKLMCTCGHIIADHTNSIPYKGYILPDTKSEEVSSILTDNIDTLIDAIKSNQRLEWIKKHFSVPPYPTDLKNSSMIYDSILNTLLEATQDIFQCENCGRIAIEVGQSNHFKFFSPDTDDTKGILNKIS